MKHILSMGLAALFLCSCNTKVETTATTETVDKGKVKSEIEAMEADYAKSFNAKDAEAVLAYYSDDAESYEAGSEPLIGKQAMRAKMQADMKDLPNGMNISFSTKDVDVSNDGEQVVELGQYTVTDSLGTDVASGHYMAHFEKKDGKYHCVREMVINDKREKK